jgi:hypothetical protein
VAISLTRSVRAQDASKAVCSRLLAFKFSNWTVMLITWTGRVCRYTRFMYNILRSDSGGVVLKCKACSHSAHVNEFDDRQGGQRGPAANRGSAYSIVRRSFLGAPLAVGGFFVAASADEVLRIGTVGINAGNHISRMAVTDGESRQR